MVHKMIIVMVISGEDCCDGDDNNDTDDVDEDGDGRSRWCIKCSGLHGRTIQGWSKCKRGGGRMMLRMNEKIYSF